MSVGLEIRLRSVVSSGYRLHVRVCVCPPLLIRSIFVKHGCCRTWVPRSLRTRRTGADSAAGDNPRPLARQPSRDRHQGAGRSGAALQRSTASRPIRRPFRRSTSPRAPQPIMFGSMEPIEVAGQPAATSEDLASTISGPPRQFMRHGSQQRRGPKCPQGGRGAGQPPEQGSAQGGDLRQGPSGRGGVQRGQRGRGRRGSFRAPGQAQEAGV